MTKAKGHGLQRGRLLPCCSGAWVRSVWCWGTLGSLEEYQGRLGSIGVIRFLGCPILFGLPQQPSKVNVVAFQSHKCHPERCFMHMILLLYGTVMLESIEAPRVPKGSNVVPLWVGYYIPYEENGPEPKKCYIGSSG